MTADVILRIYDISNGKAARFSPFLLGRAVSGVWHTSIQVFGFEYFYGGNIVKMLPIEAERYVRMRPVQLKLLGYTERTMQDLDAFLVASYDNFTPENYDVISHNCNHFTNYMAQYLLNGIGIPIEILSLPAEMNNSLFGRVALKLFKRMTENPVAAGSSPVKARRKSIADMSDQAVFNGENPRRMRPTRHCKQISVPAATHRATLETRFRPIRPAEAWPSRLSYSPPPRSPSLVRTMAASPLAPGSPRTSRIREVSLTSRNLYRDQYLTRPMRTPLSVTTMATITPNVNAPRFVQPAELRRTAPDYVSKLIRPTDFRPRWGLRAG